MSHNPTTAPKTCPIQEAARLMLARRVSCLPVTMPDGTVEGVLTWKDVCKAFLESSGPSD